MRRVVLLCGPSGSGKTTYARGLEADGFTRLSFDQEAWALGLAPLDLTRAQLAQIDAELRSRLHDLLRAGRDVVLDFSFSTRSLREEWRALAAADGGSTLTIHLATPREVCLARMRERRGAHADDVILDESAAAHHIDTFEAPTADEGPLRVIRGG
ncbi:ATP-binding protein [Brachybacterium sp. JHP9]|uniref:ATP-binding protein n=1 Tax=Brachybacterium equifaecis TaxID=2910770 RepID=A0ABT0QXG9_9MICO|nr:ATP-binding protein [Brachybacterium equifaecis]MCL6422357.1 ATP-binding protein [Brachybacterium equifaecis]